VAGETPTVARRERTWAQWFNTAAFAPAAWGRFGNSARTGAIRLPGLRNFDLSISRTAALGEQRRVEIRGDIFNLTNHFNPEPGSVDRNIQSATFGSVGGGVRGVAMRIVQLGARLYF
jgi:hypothetical protein